MPTKDELLQEVQASFCKASPEAYSEIRESYLLKLNGSYDFIRDEICHCITFNLFQASITLTNHLLELLMKNSLTIKDIGSAKITSLAEVNSKQAPSIKKYDSMTLEKTIDESFTQNIITDKERDRLHLYRKTLRNAYGHAEKGKLFKGDTFNGGMFKFDGSSTGELATVKTKDFLVIQPHAQRAKASHDAIPYFKYVDAILVRLEKQHHPEIDEQPELYKRQFNFDSK
ncbi:MAG: hypothetical protein V4520_18665 [Bacteroidota bacterium]